MTATPTTQQGRYYRRAQFEEDAPVLCRDCGKLMFLENKAVTKWGCLRTWRCSCGRWWERRGRGPLIPLQGEE